MGVQSERLMKAGQEYEINRAHVFRTYWIIDGVIRFKNIETGKRFKMPVETFVKQVRDCYTVGQLTDYPLEWRELLEEKEVSK